MNETMKSILERGSCRKYKKDPVPQDLLDQVVKAGSTAAIGVGSNPPTLVVIRNKDYLAALSDINAEIMGTKSDPFYGAPMAILVLSDAKKPTAVEDGSCALQNMMVAATSLGLGSCWINRAYETFQREDGEELLNKMGVTGVYRGIGYLILGYPEGEVKTKDHKTKVYYVD